MSATETERQPLPFTWRRQGVIVPPFSTAQTEWSAHCQMPTPIRLGDVLRVYYTARNRANRAHVFFADLDPVTLEVVSRSQTPCLLPGPPGHFDAAGVMPTSIVRRGEELWLYYIGWSLRADVPYHNAIGLAVSTDGGRTFARKFSGPIVATSANEPLFCSTADVMNTPDGWIMWYASTTHWLEIDGKMEPRYHLKVATSPDGLTWDYGERVAIDYSGEAEGAVARASVIRIGGLYHMWFCHRDLRGYRDERGAGYRLGYAWSADGFSWRREHAQRIFANEPAAGDFDDLMQAYPAVLELDKRLILLYNGDGFGQTGIGLATAEASPGEPVELG